MALDGDGVAVVDPAEVAEHQVPGYGGRLARNALHHVAVAAEGEDVVVEKLEIRPVETRRQPLGGHGHADAVAAALAERAGGRLDARGVAVLRVARTLGRQLAEAFDVVEGDGGASLLFTVLHACEVQKRVEQHRGVTVRQDEAVAVRPVRIVGVIVQELTPERICHRRQRHRRSWVAGVGLLHRVHGKCADGVDSDLVDGRWTISPRRRSNLKLGRGRRLSAVHHKSPSIFARGWPARTRPNRLSDHAWRPAVSCPSFAVMRHVGKTARARFGCGFLQGKHDTRSF